MNQNLKRLPSFMKLKRTLVDTLNNHSTTSSISPNDLLLRLLLLPQHHLFLKINFSVFIFLSESHSIIICHPSISLPSIATSSPTSDPSTPNHSRSLKVTVRCITTIPLPSLSILLLSFQHTLSYFSSLPSTLTIFPSHQLSSSTHFIHHPTFQLT